MGKEKLEKMIFVRRFLRLKRAMCFADNNPGFKEWLSELLQEVAADGAGDDDDDVGPCSDDDDVNDQAVFQDHIEPGEQRRINGQEPASVGGILDGGLRREQFVGRT